MLARQKICLVAGLLCLVSTQVLASPINVFCYHQKGNKEESFILLDAANKAVQIEARFSEDFAAFVVNQDDLLHVELECRRIASEKHLNYDHIEGSTTLSGWLHQSYLGFLSKHYRLIREKSVPLEMATATKVFLSLTDMQISEHPYDDDPTMLLRKFKTNTLDPITTKTPLAPFLEHTFFRDFHRSNFVVIHSGKVVYGHKENLIWDISQNKFAPVSLTPEQMLEQLYAAIEASIDSSLLEEVGEVQIRKNISLALATRSQAFESVPWTKVQTALMEQAAPHAIMLVANGMGRIDNIVTIEGSTITLESNSGIKVQLVQDGSWDVGLYLCHREMRIDLRTGLMTPEESTLTQFMML